MKANWIQVLETGKEWTNPQITRAFWHKKVWIPIAWGINVEKDSNKKL